MQISFTIPGRISGKGRGRATIRGGKPVVYTPEKTVSMEGVVRQYAAEAMRGATPFIGPVFLQVRIVKIPPVSWSKGKRLRAHFVTGAPDLDNILKLLGDSCNAIVWVDDSQISDLSISRRYSITGPERVEITVAEATSVEIARDDAPNVAAMPLFGRENAA